MFESIAEYIPEIEERLNQKHSPARIARDLGLAKTTIYDYKRLCFNVKNAAAQDWSEEQKKAMMRGWQPARPRS
jgi:DNA invertase Pin-like site-specific DNA recombinase